MVVRSPTRSSNATPSPVAPREMRRVQFVSVASHRRLGGRAGGRRQGAGRRVPVAAHQPLQPVGPCLEAVGAQLGPLRREQGPGDGDPGGASRRARRAVRDPHRRGRRQGARRDEGRADEGRPARQLHLRGAAGGRPGRARDAAGRRRTDGAVTRGRCRDIGARQSTGAGLPRLDRSAGRRGEHRAGPQGDHRRWARRRREGAVPGRR